MNKLIFEWVAIFDDGTKLYQYDGEKENLFQEVKNRFDNLIFFNLTNKEGKLFTVNLREGLIGYNDLIMPYRKSNEQKDNVRLVYFRRHKVEIGIKDLKQKSHIIEYHLGMQYNDKEGNNHKIILIIDQEGNWFLEE